MTRLLAVSLTFLSLACGDGDDAPTGEAQGPCYPNGTCNEGLVCASELCVDLDGMTETEAESTTEESASSPGQTTPVDPSADTSTQEGCAQALLACDGAANEECMYGYIQCAEGQGDDPCEAYDVGCDLVGWDYAGCGDGSMVYADACGGTDTTTGGGDNTTSTTSTTGADSAADAGGGDDCPAPGCSSYAAKLQSCFPGLDTDWYASCLEVYDICGAWECLPGTAGQVACVNANDCETILDGVCNDGMQC